MHTAKYNLLHKLKEQAWNNVLCYSANYTMTSPKDGYEKEWEAELNKAYILEEMIQELLLSIVK